MVLPIYLYGHPVLRKVAEDIDSSYEGLDELLKNMWETMYSSDGIGLAAPQIGLSDRIVVIDANPVSDVFPELKGIKLTLINPYVEVIEDGKVISREEGCLSLPGISESVSRTEKIKLTWQDEKFEKHEEVFEGFLSRIIQHECDHLQGLVFTDHISLIRKQLIRNKLNNIVNGKVRCSYKTKGYVKKKH